LNRLIRVLQYMELCDMFIGCARPSIVSLQLAD
jgi:hypothetical protein